MPFLEVEADDLGKRKPPTIEEKYAFLCQKMAVTDLDFWEGDGLLRFQERPDEVNSLYIGLKMNERHEFVAPTTIDEAVELAMEADDWWRVNRIETPHK